MNVAAQAARPWGEEVTAPAPVSATARNRTLRITEIPLEHLGALEDDLRLLTQPYPDLSKAMETLTWRSLVRHHCDSIATVTVSVRTSIQVDELCRRLQQICRPYIFSSQFLGITPLYEAEAGASIDVVAVPGLGSHAFGSWKSPDSDDIWLLDYLPKDQPNIRVLLYGYDTVLQHSTSKQSIENLGIDLLENLLAFRERDGTNDRPLIFIGHSLGGLLIKEALVHAHKKTTDADKLALARSCYGMMFFGVPNLGLRNEQLTTIVQGQPNQSLIYDLVVDHDSEPSTFLKRISDEFSLICKDRHEVISFFERRYSPTIEVHSDGKLRQTGKLCLLVTEKSATSTGLVAASDEKNISLDTNHSGLVKYSSRSGGVYPIVRRYFKKLVTNMDTEVPKRSQDDSTVNPDVYVAGNSKKRPRLGSDPIPNTTGRRCRRICLHSNLEKTSSDEYSDEMSTDSRRSGTEEASSQRERRKILNSLRFEQDDARRDTVTLATSGTCKWLLEEKTYRDWLGPATGSEHHRILWIKGKPGAGKSTLMKFALSEARRTHKNLTFISFFFNAMGNELERSTVGMYRWLLWELFIFLPDLQAVLDDPKTTSWKRNGKYEWPIGRLKELFIDTIERLKWKPPVVCFVDALDECPVTEIRDMLFFFEDIREKAIGNKIQFRVCFSSRHYPYLRIRHHIPLTLEDQKGHSQDIDDYINKKLTIGQSRTALAVKKKLQAKASGVFLWVILVVNLLVAEYDKANIQALQHRLDDVPDDLHTLFHTILTRDDEDRGKLLLCIQWILFAKHALTPEQLYFAVQSGYEPHQLSSWDPNEISRDDINRSLLNSSKGLAEITGSAKPTVQFIHESVRDYLLKDNGLSKIWPNLGGNFAAQSHERLKSCCATYMRLDTAYELDSSNLPSYVPFTEAHENQQLPHGVFPLMEYAVCNILHHADQAQGGGITQGPFMSHFPLKCWIKSRNLFTAHWESRYTSTASLLYILSENNLSHLISIHPSILSYLKVGDEKYGPPLFAALATSSDEAVEAFVDAEKRQQEGNRIFQRIYNTFPRIYNTFPRSNRGKSHIWHSFKFSKKIDVKRYLAEMGNPLLYSLSYFREADVDASKGDRQTSSSQVSNCGYETAVKLLLTTGEVDIDKPDKDGRTPLWYAIASGHNNTAVELLLVTGKAVADGRTPLSYAAEIAHYAAFDKLLETERVNIKKPDSDGRTPLSYAVAVRSHETIAIIEQLLQAGKTDVNKPDKDGRTPLSYAAASRQKTAVELLLNTCKADVDEPDKDDRTPLSYASAISYNSAVINLLVETGKADVNKPDKDGRTPLSYAAEGSCDMSAIELLLRTGNADAGKPDTFGRTPLSYAAAARGGFAARIINLLLKTGNTEVDKPDMDGRTPLSYAAARESYDAATIVKLLLQTGKTDVDKPDKDGRTPLSYAAMGCGYDTTVMKLLLETGQTKVDKPDKYGRTPLSYAAERESDAATAIKLLLQTGKTDVDKSDKDGRTPLSYAVTRDGDDAVAAVKLLLDISKANVNVPDKDGRTPLSYGGAKSCDAALIKQLLETGKTDVNKPDKNGVEEVGLPSYRLPMFQGRFMSVHSTHKQ